MDEHQQRQIHERREYDARVHRLEALSENLAAGLRQLTDDVHELSRVMREGNKTNWSVLGTWGGVMLALFVALGNGFVGVPLERLQNDFLTHTEYQTHLNDKEREWRRDFIADLSKMASSHEKDIEYLRKDADHSHGQLHRLTEELQNNAVSMSGMDQRIQNLERKLFPDARYRDGKPD